MSVSATCPSPRRIVRIMEEKARAAQRYARWSPELQRFVYDLEPVKTLANRYFGTLQTVDESRDVPLAYKLRAVVETLPGLIACQRKYIHDAKGELRNEMLALEGEGGLGKSSYAWWLARIVGGRLVTSVEELADAVEEAAVKGKWFPVLVLDDVAAMVSKYWVWDREERDKWKHFFKVLDYAKDWAGVVLFTARDYRGLAKRFRELVTYIGRMRRLVINHDYIIDVIEWRREGRREIVYLDVLWPGLRIPSDEFQRILEERRRRALEAVEALRGGGSGEGEQGGQGSD